MAINSVRTALQLLSGAGEVTRAKALEAAGTLLELPGVGETSARASQLAEELLEAATANQAMVSELVRTEVDGRLAFLGLARGSDLDSAQRKIDSLEREVAELRKQVAGNGAPPSAGGSADSRVSRSSITKTAAKTPAKKIAKKPPQRVAKSTASSSPAKKAAKAPAKKTASAKKVSSTKKATTKPAKKAAAKKATPRTS